MITKSLEEYRKFAIRLKVIIFGFENGALKVLEMRNTQNKNSHLPYGFMSNSQNIDSSVKSIISSYFNQFDLHWEQIKIDMYCEENGNDSVISIAVFAVIDIESFNKTDSENCLWKPLKTVNKNIDEHIAQLALIQEDKRLIQQALIQLKHRSKNLPLGFYLLGNRFTFYQLHQLFQLVLEIEIDRSNFRRKMLATGLIEPIEQIESGVQHRPARVYCFNQEKYELIKKRGFEFRF